MPDPRLKSHTPQVVRHLATAGAVRMDFLNEIPTSATLGFGEDGYRRALVLGSAAVGNGTLLGAADIYHNDGPFDNPDDYNRLNGVVRYHHGTDQDFFTLTGMAYSGKWNSTDQVPERSITEGLIGRFGTLAPTDGGTSSRGCSRVTNSSRWGAKPGVRTTSKHLALVEPSYILAAHVVFNESYEFAQAVIQVL